MLVNNEIARPFFFQILFSGASFCHSNLQCQAIHSFEVKLLRPSEKVTQEK